MSLPSGSKYDWKQRRSADTLDAYPGDRAFIGALADTEREQQRRPDFAWARDIF